MLKAYSEHKKRGQQKNPYVTNEFVIAKKIIGNPNTLSKDKILP
jgi:hypothetical protein